MKNKLIGRRVEVGPFIYDGKEYYFIGTIVGTLPFFLWGTYYIIKYDISDQVGYSRLKEFKLIN